MAQTAAEKRAKHAARRKKARAAHKEYVAKLEREVESLRRKVGKKPTSEAQAA